MQHLLKKPILYGLHANILSNPQKEIDMPNRLVCRVFDEMRDCSKTRNFSYLDGLIEEVQVLVNRMESKLMDQKDLDDLNERIRESKNDLARLKQSVKLVEEELEVKEALNKTIT